MLSFIRMLIKHKNLLIISLIAFLCFFIFIQNNRIDSLKQKNDLLNKDYDALVNNFDRTNEELYVAYERIDDMSKKYPEMKHMIDSLKKECNSTKVKIETVEVEKIKYTTDSIFINIQNDIDTVISDKCYTIFFATQKNDASIVVEFNGTIYAFHTTEKELLNPSSNSFINFIKKIVGRKKYVEKIRYVDECGLLENADFINIIE